MRIKLLIVCLISVIFSNAFAATVKSPTTPLNGNYVLTNTESCTADVNSALPGTYASSYTKLKAAQRSFTPDSASYTGTTNLQGVTGWLASSALKTFPSPTPLMNITQDPTAATGVKLTESILEWGTTSIQKTHGALTAPYASLPSFTTDAAKGYFILVSFNYSVAANNNGVQTGYAIYGINPGDTNWARGYLYMNINSTTKLMTSASHIQASTNSVSYTNGSVTSNYTFDCVSLGNLTQ